MGTSKYSRDAHTDIVLQLHEYMTHLRRSDVYGGMYLYVCVKYFFLIIWWYSINVHFMLQKLVGHLLLSGEMVSIKV